MFQKNLSTGQQHCIVSDYKCQRNTNSEMVSSKVAKKKK